MTDDEHPTLFTHPDSSSDLVEAQPTAQAEKVVVTFIFAGASLGGQGVYRCSECMALVQDDGRNGHVGWHGALV